MNRYNKKKSSNKINRWTALSKFAEWLYMDTTEKEDKHLFKEIKNFLSVKLLVSCLYQTSLLEHINKYLNSYDAYKLDIVDLAKYIKYLIRVNGIPQTSIWWFQSSKYKSKLDRLKLTKSYEKDLLIQWMDSNLVSDDLKYMDKVYYEKRRHVKMKYEDFIKTFETKDNFCMKCTLKDNPMVLFDTNVKDDITKTKILIVAEAPGATEVEKGVPLIGRSGQLFREVFYKIIGNDVPYFITNTCLCRPEDNRNPTDLEIQCCSNRLDRVIAETDPDIILTLGSIPTKRLVSKNIPITKHVGEIYDYTCPINNKVYKVIVNVHPSYVLRTHDTSLFEKGFLTVYELLKGSNVIDSNGIDIVEDSNHIAYIKLNDPTLYTQYDLVDVTEVKLKRKSNRYFLYVFRHKETKQVRYLLSDEMTYHYKVDGYHKHVLLPNEVKDLSESNKLHIIYDRGLYPKGTEVYDYTLFEGDIPPVTKAVIDYNYVLNKLNVTNDYVPRICFLDIEVYSDKFPKPEDAEYPITLISCKYLKEDIGEEYNVTYALMSKEEYDKFYRSKTDDKYLDILDKYEIKFYDDEKQMLIDFINDLHNQDIDILTAWNISFDIGYIYNRLRKLNLPDNILHRLYNLYDNVVVDIDLKRHYINIGYITLDLLTAYKFMTYGQRESYSLDYIVSYEGISGDGKKFKGSKFNYLWDKERLYAIAYNMEDVELIKKLNDKLAIVTFVNEFRKVTSVPWSSYGSNSRTSDSLIVLFAKQQGMLVRNKQKDKGEATETKIGAYVYPPIKGIHYYVFEADFASLYPSIIQTFNISPTTYVAKLKDGRTDVMAYLKGGSIPAVIEGKDTTISKDTFEVIIDPIYNPTVKKFTRKELQDFIKSNGYILTFNGTIFKNPKNEVSLIAQVITYLKERRVYYKKLYKETKEFKYYLFQLAYKIALNSLYGYLGFENSRFHVNDLVNSVTVNGQLLNKLCALTFVEALKQKKEIYHE